ncbi:hypothetical protein Q7P35_004113 [Cladosporium inversicolor]
MMETPVGCQIEYQQGIDIRTKRKRLAHSTTSKVSKSDLAPSHHPRANNNFKGGKSFCSTHNGSTGHYIGDNPDSEKCTPGTRRPISSQFARVGCEGTMPEKRHDAPGRRVSIIERWPCEIEACRNYGQMCYWTVSDEVENHLPITSVVMQFWLAAISRGECTADVPPQAIVEQWAAQNLRSLQRKEERKEVRREQRAERKSSTQKSSTRKSSPRKSSAYSR